MGRYFALTLNLPEVKTKSKKTSKVSNWPAVGFWLLAVIAFFGLLYLIQVNTLSTKIYEIRSLEKRLTELKESNRRLELEAASLKAIQNIETRVKTLNLVPSGVVKYLGTSEYAIKK